MWGLSDALDVIRPLQFKAMQCGFHLALGGGVLNKGLSDNDLDIVVLPLGGQQQRRVKFLEAADKYLGERTSIAGASGGDDVDSEWQDSEREDNVCRYKTTDGRVIDLCFFTR